MSAALRWSHGPEAGVRILSLGCPHGSTHAAIGADDDGDAAIAQLVSRHVANHGCSCVRSIIESRDVARVAAGGGSRR